MATTDRRGQPRGRRGQPGGRRAGPRAIISSKNGARVRAGAELSSAACGELASGTRVTLGGRVTLHDGTVRAEILSPVRGFVTERCLRAGPRPAATGRLWAISDLHTDHAENWDWLAKTLGGGRFRRDGLIVAGDVSSRLSVLRKTLELCAASFASVAFVVGNHDLWKERGEAFASAAEKREAIDRLCASLHVHTRPAYFSGCVVAPILSWHHQSWDTEPDVTGWENLPKAEQCMSDYYRCAFPGLDQGRTRERNSQLQSLLSRPFSTRLDMTDESVARFFDEANGPLSDDVAALRAAHPGAPLVTCSHFVPRIELVPEKRFLYVPALNKAVGSRFLGDRVAELKPDVHVFGHTHFGWDATHDGVRYLQPCLAYPSERRVRLTTVAAGDFPHAKGPLLVFDGSRFPARYVCGWSSFYEHNERRPDVTHVVPDYVARAYKRVAGVGEVGWGDHVEMPAWRYGPSTAFDSRRVQTHA
ncbi:calcineurin-like phosphoesterase [Aureococcus anophagefferens]|uniref:Calcineurin-like phosphoesterase n=1 Tax=Aureococcus anophagefferens TaxID=44056 RepID=A0ABR1GE52_AURAN